MKAPAFQFYPGDFLSSSTVRLMEACEVGAYMHLLCHAWLNDRQGYLPNCEDRLQRLSTLTVKQWQRSRAIILSKFPEVSGEPEWRYNPRLVREAEKQAIRRENLSNNGRKGGRPSFKGLDSKGPLDNQQTNEQLEDETQNQKLFPQKPLVFEKKANAKPFNFNSTSTTSNEVESVAQAASRSRRSKQPFVAPTIEQVQSYAAETFPNEPAALEEAAKFFFHFESNGWMIGGKSPMAKWPASFQSWMRRRSQFTLLPGSAIGSPGTPARAHIAPKAANAIHSYS
jgi:uncharacterized protein YdaU (DUF1376 family)